MTAKIVISFQSYWFVGTGREAGVYADSIPVKRKLAVECKETESDVSGKTGQKRGEQESFVMVPCVPGKTVKGMFRDAFETACRNEWFGEIADTIILEDCLFGIPGPNKHDNKDPGRFGNPGLLHFSTLEISDAVKAYLYKNPQAANELYRTVKSTAIDAKTGTARNMSLREYEVVVPLTLSGELSFDEEEIKGLGFSGSDDLITRLNQVAALITELGGKRTRGFGQCVIKVERA